MLKIAALAVFATFVAAPLAAAEHDFDGQWKGSVETPRGTRELTFSFEEKDGTLTGTVTTGRGDSEIQDGKVEGNTISFKQVMDFQGRSITFSYTGELKGDEIAFERTVEEMGRTSEFVAKRVK